MGEKNGKGQKTKNTKDIQFQIQSKIGLSIIAVMLAETILVVVMVYNLLIDANHTELSLIPRR